MSDPVGDVSHYCAGGNPGHAPPVTRVPALAVSGLTVRYGDVLAVDGLDLELEAGRTVALLGPNGAGKSTVVNAVLGPRSAPPPPPSCPRPPARSGCWGAPLPTRSVGVRSARYSSTAGCRARRGW